jgi:hypothetical protein
MLRAFTAVLAVAALSLVGCASSTPPPRPIARPFDDVRRVVVVVSGESAFAIVDLAVEPGRTFDEILKWIPWQPYQAALRPAAQLVHRGINWALDNDRGATAVSRLQGLSPRVVVAGAVARTLETSGWFDDVRILDREPTAEERRRSDAVVRVAVPAWGLVRVREGESGLLSGFADVSGQMVMPSTGVVMWEDSQDVTSPERIPVDAFLRDRDFARQEMTVVLERAGQRIANELLYSRSGGR